MAHNTLTSKLTRSAALTALLLVASAPVALAGTSGSVSFSITIVGDDWNTVAGKSTGSTAESAPTPSSRLRGDLTTTVEDNLQQTYRADEARRILDRSAQDALVVREGRVTLTAQTDAGWIEDHEKGTIHSL